MAKNVTIARQGSITIGEKSYSHGDPAVIPDEVYDRNPDLYDLIEEVPNNSEDLEAYTVEELKDRLRNREMKVSGTKEELIARLRGQDD